MVELLTAEQVIHYMRNNIQLSRYDKKFLDDIESLTQYTTNQVELFYRIVYKYRRQFINNELFVEKLIQLPWKSKVIESSISYTHGHVSIENNMIVFKCPFNKTFIDYFRKQAQNQYQWDKEKKQYQAIYSTHSLKLLVTVATGYFKKMEYCSISQGLIDSMNDYRDVKYWQPTMTFTNGRYYIMASNSALAEALGDIILNTDVHTLNMLAWHGVAIDESIYENTPKNKFAASMKIDVEQSNLLDIIPWLKELGCDMVYIGGSSILTNTIVNFKKQLANNDIDSGDLIRRSSNKKYSFPVILYLKQNLNEYYSVPKVAKIMQVVNSEAIDIK